MPDILALPLGLVIGTLGTLTGIGGGFILMPVLLLLYPGLPPDTLTLMTMVVVLFNSLSGTVPALIRRRISGRLALVYGLATVPSVLIGLWLQSLVSPPGFRQAFGAFMLLAAGFLFWQQARPKHGENVVLQPDRDRYILGIPASLGIGLVSSFFGVGGGFIFVPFFIYFLRQPVRKATANSQLILVFVSITTIVAGLARGNAGMDTLILAYLLVGVVGGAQIGSILAGRLRSRLVLVILASLMLIAGLRLLLP